MSKVAIEGRRWATTDAEPKPELMTLREAMEYLRISERTAHRWIRSGLLPAVKVGGRWRVPREALEQIVRVRNQNK